MGRGTIVWELHLKAANAYRNGFARSAEVLVETADAAERLLRDATDLTSHRV